MERYKRYILCGEKISRRAAASLVALGYIPVLLPPYKRLPGPVSSHPDMLVYPLSSGALLTYEEYYNAHRRLFNMLGREIITDSYLPDKIYPRDIFLNALRIGGTVYGRTDMMSRHILNDAKNSVRVRQGYARCSVCVIDDNAVITADRGIARAAVRAGTEVTLIESGDIILEGYDYGFIGGASGILPEGVAFMGDPAAHPSGEKITAAVRSRGLDIIMLDEGMLCDSGGLIIIESK